MSKIGAGQSFKCSDCAIAAVKKKGIEKCFSFFPLPHLEVKIETVAASY